MAISTYKVFLMHKASSEGTYTKLIDIKEFLTSAANLKCWKRPL